MEFMINIKTFLKCARHSLTSASLAKMPTMFTRQKLPIAPFYEHFKADAIDTNEFKVTIVPMVGVHINDFFVKTIVPAAACSFVPFCSLCNVRVMQNLSTFYF